MSKQSNESNRGETVRLSGVTRRYGSLVAVDDVSLEIAAGSFFSLLGPSGCGKSTTLRMIAGFEIPDKGKIFIGETDVTRVDARKRPTVMVFQNYALFPHMNVRENVEYGLKVRNMPSGERKKRVAESLDRVDMGGFLETPVTSLSGGQQQRIALARAVAIEPDVILFDEPLSNLDVALRQQTRIELKSLQRRLGLTSVYVTHDQEEALALSDRIALMREGQIVQVGSPRDLYDQPRTAFVASFLGGSNVITDRAQAQKLSGRSLSEKEAVSIRSEHIEISENGPLEGTVASRQFLGMVTEIELQVDSTKLVVRTTGAVPDSGTMRFRVKESRLVENDL